MLYRISVAERGLTGIANIFRSRLSRLDDLLRAGTVPLTYVKANGLAKMMGKYSFFWLLWTDWTASRRPHPADDYCSHEGSSGRNQLHHQEHGSDREAV